MTSWYKSIQIAMHFCAEPNRHKTLKYCCLRLGQRRRRWTNNKPTMAQCLVSIGESHEPVPTQQTRYVKPTFTVSCFLGREGPAWNTKRPWRPQKQCLWKRHESFGRWLKNALGGPNGCSSLWWSGTFTRWPQCMGAPHYQPTHSPGGHSAWVFYQQPATILRNSL